MKTINAKVYKKITANDSKSYLSYLNELVGQYNNAYITILLIKNLLLLIILF